ncbi:MAG TPA: MoaD/ThiS family protein [Anaerolineae bacterium]
MDVEVKLYGVLRRYRPVSAGGAPHHPFSMTVAATATPATLAAHLGIPDGLVNAAAVNSESVAADTPLQDGDQVSLFPAAAGG